MNKIEHIKLKNGINIYCFASPLLTTSSLVVTIGTGAYMEDKGVNNGWSHLLEHMLFKKSKNWNTRDRLDTFAENAIEWNATTGNDDINFFFTSPNRYYEKTFDMYLDMIFNPLFDSDELKTEREVVINEMKQGANRDFYITYRGFIEHAYTKESRKTFFTNSAIGTIGDLKKCNSESLREFYNYYFDSNNLSFTMVGPPRNYDKYIKKIEALDLKPNKKFIVSEMNKRIKQAEKYEQFSGYHLKSKEKRKSSLIYIWKPCITAKELKNNPLLSNIHYMYKMYMGGGPNSMLWNNLREDKGHVYSIDIYSEITPFNSFQHVVSEVNHSKVDVFFKDLLGTFKYFTEVGLNKKTYNRLLKGIRNDYYFAKNNPDAINVHIDKRISLGLPLITLKEYYKNFDYVTIDDIMKYHNTYWAKPEAFITGVSSHEEWKNVRDAAYKHGLISHK